jgi:L-amino acid N-acyltransferase YncA
VDRDLSGQASELARDRRNNPRRLSADRPKATKSLTEIFRSVKPRIRLALSTDSGVIADIYSPAVTDNATSFEATPPDASEIAHRIESLRPLYPWLVCEEDGTLLGYAYASRHRERAGYLWSVEVSAYVHPAAQRRLIGKALYTSLFSILALQGFRNAYAGITLPNPARRSIKRWALRPSVSSTTSATSAVRGRMWCGSNDSSAISYLNRRLLVGLPK